MTQLRVTAECVLILLHVQTDMIMPLGLIFARTMEIMIQSIYKTSGKIESKKAKGKAGTKHPHMITTLLLQSAALPNQHALRQLLVALLHTRELVGQLQPLRILFSPNFVFFSVLASWNDFMKEVRFRYLLLGTES